MARSKTALVLCSGGITGAAYQVGALAALEKMLGGALAVTDFDVFVGVSSGSIVASLVSQGLRPGALFEAVERGERGVFNADRGELYRVEWGALLRASWRVLKSVLRAAGVLLLGRRQGSLVDAAHMLQEQL